MRVFSSASSERIGSRCNISRAAWARAIALRELPLLFATSEPRSRQKIRSSAYLGSSEIVLNPSWKRVSARGRSPVLDSAWAKEQEALPRVDTLFNPRESRYACSNKELAFA